MRGVRLSIGLAGRAKAFLILVLLVFSLLGLIATPAFAGTADEINMLPSLDPLNRNEGVLSNSGKWSALAWDSSSSGHNTGSDTTGGWAPYDFFSTVNGAYWTPSTFNDKTGEAAAVTMQASPEISERYVALWLDMPNPGSAKTGYQLRWTMVSASANTYSLTLSKWSAGSQTVLASNASVVIVPGTTMAISDTGGTVSAWQGTGGSLTPILSASDSTLGSGYAGIEGSGTNSRSTNFKAGLLIGGAISGVQVLDNLERQEVPLATGTWSKSSWAGEIGGAWMGGYRGYGANSGLAGVYWNPTSFSDAQGADLVAATVGTGATPEGQYLALWLDMPNPSSARSGYEARFTGINGSSSNYKVELSKWASGTRTVLSSTSGFPLVVGTTIALSEAGGSLALWTGTSIMLPVLSAYDSTYTSGYTGLEVNGGAGTLYNFRAGRISTQPPAIPTLTASSPAPPSNDSAPLIIGSAVTGTTVKLFTNSTCTGNPVASGTAAALASPGIQVTVAENSTMSFYATATDGLGNASNCSNAVSYTEKSSGINGAIEGLWVLDQLATPENPLSGGGKWTKLGSASHPGQVQGSGQSGGWGPYNAFPTVHGAFWNTESFSDSGTGVAVAATLSVSPSANERYFSLWLDMPNPASVQTGYELRFTQTATADVYNVALSKWQAGAKTVLATAISYSFSLQSSFALADNGATVSAWTNTGSGYGQLLSAKDSTFENGYVGIEGAGNITRIREFKASASTKHIGEAEFKYDPNTNITTYTPRPGVPPMSAEADPAALLDGGELSLPETEDWVTCATTGHRIKIVYSSSTNPVPPTATRNEILSIVRRMNSKIVRESLRSSENTRALTMRVDCDETGSIRIYDVSSASNDYGFIISATETVLGSPEGADAVKYLIFRDDRGLAAENGLTLTGIGFKRADSRKISSDGPDGNLNRILTSSAVAYKGSSGENYWARYTPLHELTHTMGAVLPDAPFATTKGHCIDGLDIMCYPDGGGPYTDTSCPASQGYYTPIGVPLDCGYNSYFDAATEPGEWLSTHWNVGGSENPFLAERPANVPPGGFQTETFVTVTQVRNGRPGSVSLEGHVNITNASGEFVNNAYVNVNFEKWENNEWITKASVHSTVTNGYYEVSDSGGLGVGQWRVRTVLPEQGFYRESMSNYHEFAIEPISTETFLTLDGFKNGTPGTASVSGNVLHSGSPVSGTVNVNFQKLVSGSWQTMSTAQRTLSNGHYEVANWGVGVGQWRVRAVFPEQGDYTQSESSYHEFSIQPVPTETFLTVDKIVKGTPGTASVSGNVLHSGSPVSGTVNVNFQKLVSGSWQTMSTAQRTLSNGHYEVANWGVGAGQWRVRAVFPEQGDYAQSESSYHEFTI